MKKLVLLILACIIPFVYAGCDIDSLRFDTKLPPKLSEDITQFSYAEDLAMYPEDSPMVKRDGFVNTAELENTLDWTTDAIEHAKKECPPVQWDNFTTYYDTTLKVWKIEFWSTKDTEGYPQYIYQTVYLNNKGVTQLIVYGE